MTRSVSDILATTPVAPFRPAAAARATIEARVGRKLGPVRTMPKDLRRAMALLARQYIKTRRHGI